MGEVSLTSLGNFDADPCSVCKQRPFWIRFVSPVAFLEGGDGVFPYEALLSAVWPLCQRDSGFASHYVPSVWHGARHMASTCTCL